MLLKRLSHPLNLLLIIIAIAIVLNRDELFGGSPEAAQVTPAAQSTAEAAPPAKQPVIVHTMAEAPLVSPEEPATVSQPLPATAPPQPEPAASPSDMWRVARQAAWEGRFEESLASYRRLLVAEPDNADALGEMGNVYLQVGDWRNAVDAYRQSALLWHEVGDRARAWHLQRIISEFDWEQGQALGTRLAGNGRQKNE